MDSSSSSIWWESLSVIACGKRVSLVIILLLDHLGGISDTGDSVQMYLYDCGAGQPEVEDEPQP